MKDGALAMRLSPGTGGATAATSVTRRTLGAWLGLVSPLLASACDALGRGGAGPSTTLSQPVTITAWFPVPGGQDPVYDGYVAVLQPQVSLFQQANPKITVDVQGPGPTVPLAKVQAAVVGGDPPDIWQANYIPMFALAQQGALEPIDAYLDRRGKGDFYEWAREGSTVDGKLYEWPWTLLPTGVVANRSLFAEKNATHLLPKPGPKADWTFDQWKAALRAVTTLKGDPERDVYGTAFLAGATGGDYWQMMYLWGNGAELYDREQTKVTICSPEGVAGLQMLVDLIHRDRVAAPGAENLNAGTLRTMFLAKRLGIANNGNPTLVGLVERGLRDRSILPPFEAQFLPPPHAPGKKPAAYVGITSLLVFRRDQNKERTHGAMRLGYHLTDNPAQRAVTPMKELPVRKSAGNIYPDDPNLTTAYAAIENARDMGHFPENGEIRVLWQKAAQAAFASEKTPKNTLDDLCRLAEPIMTKSMTNRTKR